jgi:Spy/CpxP family protein refolding chaperone
MRFLIAFGLLAAFTVLLAGTGAQSQEKKDTTAKTKGILPQGYAKIGLSDEQRIQIYKIQAKYKDEIEKLKEKIEETKAEERREMDKVLTAEQRKKLIDVITGGSEPKKDTKQANP